MEVTDNWRDGVSGEGVGEQAGFVYLGLVAIIKPICDKSTRVSWAINVSLSERQRCCRGEGCFRNLVMVEQ